MSDDTTTTATDPAPEPERAVTPIIDHKTVPAVYAAMCEAMSAIQAVGKERRSDHGNFKFRGIDDVLNAVGPVLRSHCLIVSPRLISKERTVSTSKNGGGLVNTQVEVEFDFISGADGSKHTVGPIPGEGMDTGDKSTVKAMSVALRTCLIQVFAIPTEDRDPDHDVYEVAAPTAAAPRTETPRPRKAQSGDYDPWADDNPERVTYYAEAIAASGSQDSLKLVWAEIKSECESGKLSAKDGKHLHNLTSRRIEVLKKAEAAAASDPEAAFHTA